MIYPNLATLPLSLSHSLPPSIFPSLPLSLPHSFLQQHVVYRVDPKQSGEIGKYSRLVTDNVHSDLSSRKRKDMRGNSSPTPTATVTATATAIDTKGENEKINGKRKGDTQTAEAMDVQGSGDVDQPESESDSDSENAASLRVKELKLHVLLKILNKFEVT